MRLRKLRSEDATLMLEWLQDENVVCYLMKDFKVITLEGYENFIVKSETDKFGSGRRN